MNDPDVPSAVENRYNLWQALRAAGKPVAPEALCQDHPALLSALLQRIAAEAPGVPATPAEVPLASAVSESPACRYEVVSEHARGGMGRVSVAIDTELNRRVAFKDIQDKFADDPATRHRFTREAILTGQLEHPGVIPVYGLGADANGRPFYAMRFVEGTSLKDEVREFHRRPPTREPVGAKGVAFRGLLKRFIDVCNAVAFAHSKQIVHRDLKPANVMLGPFGETLVVDWGLARSFADTSPEPVPAHAPDGAPASEEETTDLQATSPGDGAGTRTGQVMGSPAYMSPEQAAGDLPSLGPAWDIYSLGATLYELLTGRAPFSGKRIGELLRDIQRGAFLPPRAVAPWVPKPLDAIARKAMATDPDDRYGSALDLAAEIDRYLADEPVRAHREPFSARARRWARRNRFLVTTATAVAVIGVLAGGTAFAVVHREQGKRLDAEEAQNRALVAQGKALEGEAQARQKETEALQKEATARRREVAALQKEAQALGQARATLDTTTDELVGKVLAKQARIGPDERAFLEKLVASYDRFAAEPGTSPEAKLLSARARLRVAQIRERLGDSSGAADDFRAAIDVLRPLAATAPDGSVAKRELLTALLGHVRVFRGNDPDGATQAFKEAREALLLSEKAANADPNNRDRIIEFARTKLAVGNLFSLLQFIDMGGLAHAETLYRHYISSYQNRTLSGEFGSEGFDMLGDIYDHLGKLQMLKKPPQLDEAYKVLDGAVGLFSSLERTFPNEPRYRHRRAHARTTQVLLLIGAGKKEEAEQVIEPLVVTYRDLVRRFPAVQEFREGLAYALATQIAAFEALDKRADVLRATVERRAVFARLVAEYPEHNGYRTELVLILRSLAKKYSAADRPNEAQEAADEADAVEGTARPKK
jgi:serine/threonine-protein kinase